MLPYKAPYSIKNSKHTRHNLTHCRWYFHEARRKGVRQDTDNLFLQQHNYQQRSILCLFVGIPSLQSRLLTCTMHKTKTPHLLCLKDSIPSQTQYCAVCHVFILGDPTNNKSSTAEWSCLPTQYVLGYVTVDHQEMLQHQNLHSHMWPTCHRCTATTWMCHSVRI